MEFGNNIQNLRKFKNLSQEKLAEMVGVSRQSISKWECNEDYPSWNKIPILCRIFNCSIEDLISNEELGKIMDLEKLKSDGMERIKKELNRWDSKARKSIIINLMKRLEKNKIQITMYNLIELVELI